jgi:hypothetical protein
VPYDKLGSPQVIAKNEQLTKLLTADLYAYLISLIPTPQTCAEISNRHQASYTASLKGGEEAIKECEADRLAGASMLKLVNALGKAFTIVDPKVPQMLGMEQAPEKASAAATIFPEPQDFKVVFNSKGQLLASVTKVKLAKAYEVWGCDGDPSVEANWRRLAESFICKGIVLNGVNREKTIWLKIRAMRSTGPGPWSNVITFSPA